MRLSSPETAAAVCPGLPASWPCLRSPDRAADALLMASLLRPARRLRGWDVLAGRICLVSKHPRRL